MSVDSVLARGRQVRLKLMRSRVRIYRAADRTFDTTTGEYTGEDTTIYEGPCHFKVWSPIGARIADAGERETVETQYDIAIPWETDSDAPSTSDLAVLTSCAETWVVGRILKVVTIEHSNDRTARHISAVDQDGGVVTFG